MKINFAEKAHGNNKVVKEFNKGSVPFYKHCLRYGVIVSDTTYEAEEGYYKGFNRTIEVLVNGLLCSIRMNNGKVREYGYATCGEREQKRVIRDLGEI